MALLIILQDAALRNYLEAFHGKFSAPQWKYFVTVLMGLLYCNGNKTLSGMLREVAVMVTMSGLSRFLISPAWNVAVLDQVRYQQFTREVSPIVAQLHLQQKAQRVRRRGRPSPTLVTGYLIMDDSTHAKRYYAKAASGLGRQSPVPPHPAHVLPESGVRADGASLSQQGGAVHRDRRKF